MLIVRNAQMEAMDAGRDDSLAGAIVTQETEKDPKLTEKYENQRLFDMARNGIKRARSHGFENPADLIAFVEMMFDFAPNFDQQPDIEAVLSDRKIEAEEKIEKIKGTHIPEEAWEEARENYDEDAWASVP